MIIAHITLNQAQRAAYLLQSGEDRRDEVADALLAIANDTDIIMTSDGAGDAELERLIRAAPDMLAALKYFVQIPLDQLNKLAEGKVTNIGYFEIAQRRARSAIAKAEGRAND